ncbi:MAG: MBL fold metallo-hydrolase [Bdellovibrionales bacterium]|nr:MBL fold metallo-hydrolase [Bdellovibrionales bacterium]
MKAKIEILGCGTSTGVPIPLCDCNVCTSTDPKNQRLRSSAVVSLPTEENILIDTSTDFRQQILRSKLSSIEAVLYTHAHSDHYLGIDDLKPIYYANNKEIPCYADLETAKRIKQIFDYIFSPDPSWKGSRLPELKINHIKPWDSIEIAGKTIEVFPLYHGDMLIQGFKFGNLAYATDCNRIPEETKKLLTGIDILILDAVRVKSHPSHFTIEEAIASSQELSAGNTYLTHMSHDVEYQEDSKKLPENVYYCYDGMTLEFDWP